LHFFKAIFLKAKQNCIFLSIVLHHLTTEIFFSTITILKKGEKYINMKKKIEKFCFNNICESCAHNLKELGHEFFNCDLACFTLEHGCSNSVKNCLRCGQEMDLNKSPFDFSADLDLLQSALNNPNLKVVGFTAPSVRVALGDEFGFSAGENVEGKMVAALKKLGFYKVFDMNTAADFTTVEEAYEFTKRLKNKKNLPLLTSCCPGWVSFCKKLYPDLVKYLSSCKSPQQMFGALINNYFAEKEGISSTDMFVVSIVPCLAKKVELLESENTNVGQDVDVAISTKELSTLLKSQNIDLTVLKDESFDGLFGSASGAGAIFGSTGGVSEAVMRTASHFLIANAPADLEYEMIRGLEGVRRATLELAGERVNIAIVTGLKNLPPLLEEVKKDKDKYQFIEVMACDGGCIGGPGQPKVDANKSSIVLQKRSESLYQSEKKKPERRAHENPALIRIYDDYLGKVGGSKAEKLLHRKFK